jgi:hypothetical protein
MSEKKNTRGSCDSDKLTAVTDYAMGMTAETRAKYVGG